MSHSPLFRSHSMCDFCDARPIAKIYDAAPVVTVFAGERILFPDTKWPACASCATLIDQGRWADLTDRCAEIWLKEMRNNGIHTGYRERSTLRQDLERMHASFREAMGRTA
jgi:hypothetical protein